MVFVNLCQEYYQDNKSIITIYIVLSTIFYIFSVLVFPYVASKIGDITKHISIYVLILIVLITAILGLGIYFYRLNLQNRLFPSFTKHIRTSLVRNYLKNNKMNFKESQVTSDITKIYDISQKINHLLLWIISTFIPVMIVSGILVVYFFYLSPVLGMITLLSNVAFYWFGIKKLVEIDNLFKENSVHHDIMLSKLDNIYNNIMNIYLHQKTEDTIRSNYIVEKEYESKVTQYNMCVSQMTTAFHIILYLFFILSILYVYYSPRLASDFYSIVIIIALYMSRVDTLIDDIPGFITNGLFSINESKKFHHEETVFEPLGPITGAISIRDMTYAYAGSHATLFTDFSLEIKPKERIAIIGQSGTGKSTLFKLLLGFYKPSKGTISIDGRDIQSVHPDELRKNVYYINQRTLLFEDSILENMKYGSSVSDQDVFDLIRAYQLLSVFHPTHDNDMECLQNRVESNGSNMSLGMQKVIFLVRGILQRSSIYLIDEPFASLDKDTRQKIFNMIQQETLGKTVVIITHDQHGINDLVDRMISL